MNILSISSTRYDSYLYCRRCVFVISLRDCRNLSVVDAVSNLQFAQFDARNTGFLGPGKSKTRLQLIHQGSLNRTHLGGDPNNAKALVILRDFRF